MRTYCHLRATGIAAFWIAVPLTLLSMAAALGADNFAAESGMQVLTRGPVHEAFAEASMAGATAGFTIDRAPYEPIVEVPPDQRPDGADVAWIPGYWSWDEDRSDFIWVSGVWRDLPPGRQWVPGYWTPARAGYQWISGFWGNVGQTEIDYLPPPPQTLEAGPSSPTPRPGNVWSPGSWVWQQSRYDWQPGFWVAQQPDWVWTPAHYTWTPRGYVYVPGYWDYDLVHRGVIFAPVYYEQPVYRRPNYYYSPAIIIDLRAITACLFVQPRSHHYYFGDYYDARYDSRGFYPWYVTRERDYGYDPLYGHYRLEQLRHDRDWDTHVAEQYHHRRDHVDARPPQTLAIQININTSGGGAPDNHFLGRSLAESAERNTQPLRFRTVDPAEREQIETRGRQVRTFQAERARIETPTKDAGKPGGPRESGRADRVNMPVSPVSTRSSARSADARTPPPVPVAPKPQVTDGRGRGPKPRNVDDKPVAPRSRDNSRTETPRVQGAPENGRARQNPQVEGPRATEPVRDTKPRDTTPRPAVPSLPVETVSGPEAQSPEAPRIQVNRTSAPVAHSASTPETRDRNVRVQKPEPRAESPRKATTIRHGRQNPPERSAGNPSKKKDKK